MATTRPCPVDHIVVVMLENRSYDHLFAYLGGPPAFAGRFRNPAGPLDPTKEVPLSDHGDHRMSLDPPHSHPAALEAFAVNAAGRYRMTGFVAAAARKAAGQEDAAVQHWMHQGVAAAGVAAVGAFLRARVAGTGLRRAAWVWAAAVAGITGVQVLRRWAERRRLTRRLSAGDKARAVQRASEVMACMAPARIPVLAELARSFTRCTRWFCSVPGETWPNRTFLHCGTSEGTVEIEVGLYDTKTIFDRLEEGRSTKEDRDRAWRIYVDDGIPHVAVFRRLWSSPERRDRWSPLAQFAHDVEAGALPAYSFIEPRHQPPASNSQHPGNNPSEARAQPSDFEAGEHLLAHVYETLRRHPAVFNRTLLVITYDENGGLFDHVSPPRAVAPGPIGRRHWTRRVLAWFVERHHYPFTFRRLGARVPALVVSPLLPPADCDVVFDHTSVPATVRACFAPQTEPLSRREAKANLLTVLPLLGQPRTDLPDLSAWAERRTDVLETTDEIRAADGVGAEPDPFSRQLDALAERLDAELPQREASVSADEVQSARVTADRHRDVVVRLLGR